RARRPAPGRAAWTRRPRRPSPSVGGASPVARAASSGPSATSSFGSLERTLDRTIDALSQATAPQARALLIEARRLRSVVANWRSIPPPADVHDEMLDRVLQLSTAVGTALPEVPDTMATEVDPQISMGDMT